jgi:uncharacterized damage-inducible protein DinB
MELQHIDSFLAYYESVRGRTLRVLRCIPRDHFEWTYRDGKFSFADLIRHIAATERYMFTENALGRPSAYPGHGRNLADGYEQVFDFFERSHADSVALLKTLTPADLQRKCTTPAGIDITVWKWLRAMIEHEIHHRGQFYIYLGILGVPSPPLYGLTSEQVFERTVEK